jgi:uncharacterized membrane protein
MEHTFDLPFVYVVLILLLIFLGWVLFYYVVKAAIKNAIIESRMDDSNKPSEEFTILTEKYHKGELTFEEYQNKWKELSKG